MSEAPTTTLISTVLNSPDPQALGRFYAALLGWEVGADDPGWVKLINPNGGPTLAFQPEDIYERPVWPAEQGQPQMMMHLDIHVTDLAAASGHAIALGATLAAFQPEPDNLLVHLDPDGHPFCLFLQ